MCGSHGLGSKLNYQDQVLVHMFDPQPHPGSAQNSTTLGAQRVPIHRSKSRSIRSHYVLYLLPGGLLIALRFPLLEQTFVFGGS